MLDRTYYWAVIHTVADAIWTILQEQRGLEFEARIAAWQPDPFFGHFGRSG